MAILPEWTDTSDAPIVAAISFASVAPGASTSWTTLRLWNDRLAAGSDSIVGARLSALAKPQGVDTPYLRSGVPVLDWRAVEVEVESGGVSSLGSGATVSLPAIAAESYVTVRFRVSAPAGLALDAADVLIRLNDDPWVDLGDAAPEQGGLEIGRASQLFEGGLVAEASPEDETVIVAAGAAEISGKIRGWAETALSVDDTDSASATLGSGEAYAARVVVDLGGPRLIKGLNVTSPPATTDYPPIPTGSVWLADVVRRFGANVEAADVTDRRVIGGFAPSTPGGLGLRIGPGIGIVGTRRLRADVPIEYTAGTGLTDYVLWLDEQRQPIATDGAPLIPGEAIARFSTSGVAVTSIEDLRRVAGSWRCVTGALPGLATGEIAILPVTPGGIEICPIRGAVISLGDDTATLGNTSGDWEIEIEAFVGGAWTSIYPDGVPTIAFDAAASTIAPTPQVLHTETHQLRARLAALPSGGSTAPLGISIFFRQAFAG